jgi:hypothetical protein
VLKIPRLGAAEGLLPIDSPTLRKLAQMVPWHDQQIGVGKDEVM